jgi:hypothetical protein
MMSTSMPCKNLDARDLAAKQLDFRTLLRHLLQR